VLIVSKKLEFKKINNISVFNMILQRKKCEVLCLFC